MKIKYEFNIKKNIIINIEKFRFNPKTNTKFINHIVTILFTRELIPSARFTAFISKSIHRVVKYGEKDLITYFFENNSE